jgi:CheY-like chemotaxis protein
MLDILRSTTETKNVKVIMMTALSSEDQRARGEALGADRYLVKSQVGIEDVVRTVHDVLGDGAAQPAAPAFTPAPAPAPVQPTYSQPEPAPVAQAQPYAAPYQVPQPAAPAPQPYIPPTPAPITEPTQVFAPAPQFSAPAAPFVPPTPAPVFQPAAAPAPTPQPFSAPAPQFAAPQPMQQPFQAPAPTSMPQPIAPFSSPAPASLGERVIEPLTMPPNPGENVLDLSSQIEQALNNQSTPPAPTPPTV